MLSKILSMRGCRNEPLALSSRNGSGGGGRRTIRGCVYVALHGLEASNRVHYVLMGWARWRSGGEWNQGVISKPQNQEIKFRCHQSHDSCNLSEHLQRIYISLNERILMVSNIIQAHEVKDLSSQRKDYYRI